MPRNLRRRNRRRKKGGRRKKNEGSEITFVLRDEPITAKQLRDALALASWDLVRAYFEHDLFDDLRRMSRHDVAFDVLRPRGLKTERR